MPRYPYLPLVMFALGFVCGVLGTLLVVGLNLPFPRLTNCT